MIFGTFCESFPQVTVMATVRTTQKSGTKLRFVPLLPLDVEVIEIG